MYFVAVSPGTWQCEPRALSVDRCFQSSLYTSTSLCVENSLTLQTWNVHTDFMDERDVQRARAAQVGLLMRSYRESFSSGGGRRGLTQEALLERMGSVDSDYAERYSHATVSRWESGGTRPTLRRLNVLGKALDLSRTEVAGLVLLAGLATDFRTAVSHVTRGGDVTNGNGETPEPMSAPGVVDNSQAAATESATSVFRAAVRFGLLRTLPLALCIAGGYALSAFGWNNAWMPTVYVAFATGIVLAQGFLLPDRRAPLREFFWVSLFFLLTTPLLQFGSIRMDHYGLYRIGDLAGTQMPYMLALLVNLGIASAAGLMFHVLWKWQYSGNSVDSSALRRAASVALPPLILVYAVVVVITNISVSIQLATLLPVLGAVFTALLVLRDPAFSPSERDRLFLLSTASVLAMISTALGVVVILSIYLSPDLPSVLPDHNQLRSWEIDFAGLGFTTEEVFDRLNVGYLWHAIWVLVYMFFVVGGRLMVSIYRLDGSRQR